MKIIAELYKTTIQEQKILDFENSTDKYIVKKMYRLTVEEAGEEPLRYFYSEQDFKKLQEHLEQIEGLNKEYVKNLLKSQNKKPKINLFNFMEK